MTMMANRAVKKSLGSMVERPEVEDEDANVGTIN
jgi:hypothetical protein